MKIHKALGTSANPSREQHVTSLPLVLIIQIQFTNSFEWKKVTNLKVHIHQPLPEISDGLMVKGQSGIQSNQGFVDFAALKLIPKIVKYVLKACVVTVCLHNCTITIKSVPIKRVTWMEIPFLGCNRPSSRWSTNERNSLQRIVRPERSHRGRRRKSSKWRKSD